MKSSLARPLENYFCLGLNLQMTRSTSKKLALDQKSAQIILGRDSNQLNRQPTSHRVGRQESPPRKKLSHIQTQEQQAHPSAKPATSAANSRHV